VLRVIITMMLVAVIAWNVLAVNFVRQLLIPVMSRSEVAAYAQAPLFDDEHGLRAIRYSGRSLVFEAATPPGAATQDLSTEQLTSFACVTWGRLFGGPVDGFEFRFVSRDGLWSEHTVPRQTCRDWYAETGQASRRPGPLLPPGVISLEDVWKP
jgi:hypothetical protein